MTDVKPFNRADWQWLDHINAASYRSMRNTQAFFPGLLTDARTATVILALIPFAALGANTPTWTAQHRSRLHECAVLGQISAHPRPRPTDAREHPSRRKPSTRLILAIHETLLEHVLGLIEGCVQSTPVQLDVRYRSKGPHRRTEHTVQHEGIDTKQVGNTTGYFFTDGPPERPRLTVLGGLQAVIMSGEQIARAYLPAWSPDENDPRAACMRLQWEERQGAWSTSFWIETLNGKEVTVQQPQGGYGRRT